MTPPDDTTKPAKGAAGDADPLKALENILQDAKSKSQAGDKAAAEEKEKAEQKRQRQELEKQIQDQALIDEKKLQQQVEDLGSIEQSPEYKARKKQDEEKKEKEAKEKSRSEGLVIRQLGHDKV